MPIAFLFVLAIMFLSCGTGTTKCYFTSLNVSGTSATADHAAIAPGNQVQFTAFGSGLTSGCVATQSNLRNVTWSVSDTTNVSISNVQDITNGVATCIHATSGPLTVTATLPADQNNGVIATGTSTLTCR